MIFRVIEMSVCPGLTSIWKEEDMACGEGAEDQVVPLPSISYWPVIYSIGTFMMTFTMKYEAWQATQATNISY